MKVGKFLGMVVVLAVILVISGGEVSANEGVFELKPVGESVSSCYVLSIFEANNYKILGTCRNLVVPFSAEVNRYVMWKVEEDGTVLRVGEVQDGKISGQAKNSFTSLMVTAESIGTPRKPSSFVVARGNFEKIPLVGGLDSGLPSPSVVKKTVIEDETVEATVEAKQSGSLVKFLSALGRIIGVIFLVVLVMVVVMTVVMRRKDRA